MTAEDWAVRERRWRGKLGRLRLGVEPLTEQLARHRRVAWALTVVPGGIGLMFVALFAAFGAPLVGLGVGGGLVGPIVLVAWLDYARLAHRVRDFEMDRQRSLGAP